MRYPQPVVLIARTSTATARYLTFMRDLLVRSNGKQQATLIVGRRTRTGGVRECGRSPMRTRVQRSRCAYAHARGSIWHSGCPLRNLTMERSALLVLAAALTFAGCGARPVPVPDPPEGRAHDGVAELTL